MASCPSTPGNCSTAKSHTYGQSVGWQQTKERRVFGRAAIATTSLVLNCYKIFVLRHKTGLLVSTHTEYVALAGATSMPLPPVVRASSAVAGLGNADAHLTWQRNLNILPDACCDSTTVIQVSQLIQSPLYNMEVWGGLGTLANVRLKSNREELEEWHNCELESDRKLRWLLQQVNTEQLTL
eukprot:5272461-Amphidinium_carterae.2